MFDVTNIGKFTVARALDSVRIPPARCQDRVVFNNIELRAGRVNKKNNG